MCVSRLLVTLGVGLPLNIGLFPYALHGSDNIGYQGIRESHRIVIFLSISQLMHALKQALRSSGPRHQLIQKLIQNTSSALTFRRTIPFHFERRGEEMVAGSVSVVEAPVQRTGGSAGIRQHVIGFGDVVTDCPCACAFALQSA